MDPDLEPAEWGGFAGTEPIFYGATEADARLIAAAPEMLAALQLAVDDHVGTAEDCEDDCWSHVARTALAKARGEQ